MLDNTRFIRNSNISNSQRGAGSEIRRFRGCSSQHVFIRGNEHRLDVGRPRSSAPLPRSGRHPSACVSLAVFDSPAPKDTRCSLSHHSAYRRTRGIFPQGFAFVSGYPKKRSARIACIHEVLDFGGGETTKSPDLISYRTQRPESVSIPKVGGFRK